MEQTLISRPYPSEVYSIRDWYRMGAIMPYGSNAVRSLLYKRLIQAGLQAADRIEDRQKSTL